MAISFTKPDSYIRSTVLSLGKINIWRNFYFFFRFSTCALFATGSQREQVKFEKLRGFFQQLIFFQFCVDVIVFEVFNFLILKRLNL